MYKIVKSIVKVLIVQSLTPFYINEKILGETGFALYQKIKKMPLTIKISIYISTFIFDWAGLFYGGSRFSLQNIEQQQKMFHVLEQNDWYPLKKFLRAYQKLSLFIYYSLLAELKNE
jgi:hypothetical protein